MRGRGQFRLAWGRDLDGSLVANKLTGSDPLERV